MDMRINGVHFKSDINDITKHEAEQYVDFVKNKIPNVDNISVTAAEDDFVDINWHVSNTKFERIRRVTGYLTGDISSWNDAKQAEEKDRVKHDKDLSNLR